MAVLNSLDLLAKKAIVQSNEVDTKITFPNTTGPSNKIDAVDHNQVSTAIVNLIEDLIDSSYNKLDGISLEEIIQGINNGEVLIWNSTTSSWDLGNVSGVTPVGNLGDVQLKGIGNTLDASSNLNFDIVNSQLTLTDSGFDVILPNDTSKDFNVLINGSTNNLLTVGGNGDIIIGDTDSNITLRRGTSSLDESLTLSSGSLLLENSLFTIQNANGSSFEVVDSGNDVKMRVRSEDLPVFIKSGLRFFLDTGGQPVIESPDGQTLDFRASLGQRFYSNNTLAFDTFPPGFNNRVTFYFPAYFTDTAISEVFQGSDENAAVRHTLLRGGNGVFAEAGGDVLIQTGQPSSAPLGALTAKIQLASYIDNAGTALLQPSIEILEGLLKLLNIPQHADQAAAVGAGLSVDTVYKTPTGELRIVI